ncbi:hypothetical protein BDAP_002778 [Binucleata daphniae]
MFVLYCAVIIALKDENMLLNDTNTYRIDHNKKELKENKKLNLVATEIANYACTMLMMDVKDVEELRLDTLLRKNQYGDVKSSAVNISTTKGSNKSKILQDWKKNKFKNENLLGDYEDTGLASCEGKDKNMYYVQIYAKKYEY